MAKDPAFLFYYQDFLVGTEFMTAEEIGCYIRILCHLADKGSLSLEHMQSICRGYAFTDNLKAKFSLGENGEYFNQRLSLETQKRRSYTESRRKNAKAYAKHMENENENINKDTKDITTTIIYTKEFDKIWSKYPDKDGKSAALRHFKATVKTPKDVEDINKALDNYLQIDKVNRGYIKKGSTWFNQWQDFIDYQEPPKDGDTPRLKKMRQITGEE